MKEIDPGTVGLRKRVKIIWDDHGKIALLIDRKSRIIMKDVEPILSKIEKIRNAFPSTDVYLKTTAPFCRKTKAHLNEKGVIVKTFD